MSADPLAAFADAQLAEDEATASGLAFACRNPDLTPDFGGCGGPAAEDFWARFNADRALRQVAFGRILLADYLASVRRVGPCLSIAKRNLVLVYAAIWSSHPDYEQAITCSHDFYGYGGDRRCVTCGTVVKAD